MSMTVQHIKILTFAIISSLLYSCAQEEVVNKEDVEELTPLRIGLRGGNPLLDDEINTLRIMAFDPVTGACRSNKIYNTSTGSTITHQINQGTYNFIFLGNEPATVSASLDNITFRTGLDAIAYPASIFTSELQIPMMQTVENVAINSAGVSINSGPVLTEWELALVRLAARIDIVLSSAEDITTAFTGVRFTNIPDVVPLTSGYTGTVTRNGTREFTLATNVDYFESVTLPAGTAWAHKVTRVILPSSEFTPKTNASEAVTFTVLLHNQYNPSCTMGVDEVSATKDYTLPRNNWLDAEGDVKVPLVMNIKALDWGVVGVPGDIPDNRELKVSHIKGMVTRTNHLRIEFWSNQPEVKLLDNTKANIPVNNLFQGLTGVSPANFEYIYDPGTKTGHGTMTLFVNEGTTETINDTQTTHTLVLDAGGLRREINIETWVWAKAYNTLYIGTFHRASEVGERVVAFLNSGNWTATVSYTTAQAASERFVVLSGLRSSDPMIGTDTPGDPENYPVVVGDGTNGSLGETVSGTGMVYFRVGMKSKLSNDNPDYNTAPRYARITITRTSGTHTIFVRQGEAPDYVMRPTDNNGAGNITTAWGGTSAQPRPVARKFAVYNITAQQYLNNPVGGGANATDHTQIALNGGVFVKYPSQGGAHFQAANATHPRRAYHLTNPAGAITGWNTVNPSGFWNTLQGTHETCPSTYRRPTDGATNAYVTGVITNSEARQSLWLNPVTNFTKGATGSSNLDNRHWGWLADGFFDRRAMVASTVGYNAERAFHGALFYNLSNNASLFLPGAGYRDETNGTTMLIGNATYWTSSSYAPTTALTHVCISSNRTDAFMGYNYRSIGLSIRCVKP